MLQTFRQHVIITTATRENNTPLRDFKSNQDISLDSVNMLVCVESSLSRIKRAVNFETAQQFLVLLSGITDLRK